MTTLDVLYRLADRRILLELDGDRIRWTGPAGAMTPELADVIRDHRTALIQALRSPREDLANGEEDRLPRCPSCGRRADLHGTACVPLRHTRAGGR